MSSRAAVRCALHDSDDGGHALVISRRPRPRPARSWAEAAGDVLQQGSPRARGPHERLAAVAMTGRDPLGILAAGAPPSTPPASASPSPSPAGAAHLLAAAVAAAAGGAGEVRPATLIGQMAAAMAVAQAPRGGGGSAAA
ncbi:hypothetical protein Rsub_06544 [Raphidocelis subcapitata]|uniref:Uncharacterized protein n=1 Tax=Raphidocelis subcapitata TaxID=307507 RepID=A0A2V0P326_9CHLO|nr:hypothetical protein Rsub_06544 [Raphidocelis subcapitata]|eukprot:GBF94274.1 hypothetical protein Rsub_06544 [Raphidocelis subcapitata]